MNIRNMEVKFRRSLAGRAILTFALACGFAAGISAQPVVKTGPCPAFTRSAMKMPFGFQNNTMQDPLAPAQSINCIQTPPGFQAQLWASEQDAGAITAGMAFTFDERGRLWLVESRDYPNILTQPFAGHDRIVILEDANQDGRMDKFTVFAEGYNIAQSIEWTPAGLAVAMPPYLLLLEDRNGDDKADDPKGKILYTGFTRGDTHMTISNLHLGLDNWLYGMAGSIPGTANGVSYNAGFWRARMDGSKFEYLSRTTNNTWGLGMLEDGQIFGSTANNNESAHFMMRGKDAQQLLAKNRIHPITDDWMQHAPVGTFSAASGHDMYTSRLFPRDYWGKAGFVCEPTAHLIAQFFFTPKGSTWKGSIDASRYNILASTDAWTAPIMAKVGPDGALWVLDWYSYIIQHNGDPSGPGRAFITELRTKKYCRIYRIVPTGKPLEPTLDLRTATLPQLAQTFSNPNLLWRMQAQRLLLAKAAANPAGAKDIVLLLRPLLASRIKDDVDNDPNVVHAVWILNELGLFQADPAAWNPVLKGLLLHPASGVRRNVLMALPRTEASAQLIKEQGRVNDPNAHVRLQALFTLSEIPGKGAGISMFRDYRHADADNVNLIRENTGGLPAPWADLAFAAAGVTEASALPAIPALETPTVALPYGKTIPVPRHGIRFKAARSGSLAIGGHSGLPPGRLLISDLRGRAVATLSYDGYRWSRSGFQARAGAVLVYEFIGAGAGIRFQGKVASEGALP